MAYSVSVTELIKCRTSLRSYDGRSVEAAMREKLEAFMAAPGPSLFGSAVRFQLLNGGPREGEKLPGTYGVIKGALNYVAGAVRKGPMDMEDFGYLFEKVILYAADLGLATCWIGGTLNRTSFAERMGLDGGEILPAISPVGYAASRRTIRDSVMRFSAGSKKRKSWERLFFRDGFDTPLGERDAGPWAVPLEMVRLAPSATNKQPWRVMINETGVHFFLQRNPTYSKIFPGIDLQRIDMGIAFCHFDLTLREIKRTGTWARVDVDAGQIPPRTEYIASWIG